MTTRILFILSILIAGTILAQVSPKRGIAYGYHSTSDLTAIHQGASWWYNWTNIPDANVNSTYQTIGMEYVPMCWNDNFNVNTVIANIPNGAKYLLAFNEPNFLVEANMTPQQAVNAWSKIEQVAAAKNLEIVSAAPAYGSTGSCISGYTSPITWHDEFFNLCPTCKVDYIAFHCYENTTAGLIALVNNLKKYNRPIWVTEFACWDTGVNATDKQNYLTTAVSSFENDPDIYRYSWFTGRSNSNSSINLFNATSGSLTNLGNAYVSANYGPQNAVPGTIQAENHYRRRGTGLENTTDAGGGQNVGWLDPWDWNEYIINVSQTGNYQFDFRVASLNTNGLFDIYVDNQLVKSDISFNATGGYQTWTTHSVSSIPLNSGQHLMKLVFKAGGFNINYIQTSFQSATNSLGIFENAQLILHPNPHQDFFQLTNSNSTETFTMEIYSLDGKLCFTKKIQTNEPISLPLEDGIYLLKLIGDNKVFTSKISKGI